MYCSKCGAVVADGAAFCSACGQPSPAVGATPVVAPLGIPMGVQVSALAPVVYAGFWLRFVALIIDSIVMWILGAIVLFPLVGAMGITAIFRGMNTANGGQMRPEDILPFMTLFFRIILISAAYFPLCCLQAMLRIPSAPGSIRVSLAVVLTGSSAGEPTEPTMKLMRSEPTEMEF